MNFSVTLGVVLSVAGMPLRCPAQNFRFYDNGEVALWAVQNAGVQEPSIPLLFGGVRVDNPGTPGPDLYDIVEFYDRVPGTGSYPLTVADIVANGYLRPLVQRANGSATPFGTSVISGPSFRALGQPLDLIPEMTDARVTLGNPQGDDRVSVRGAGVYGAAGGVADLISIRRYPDPLVGRTTVFIDLTWRALANITLAPAPGGRGFDAFRLVMFSSMLADIGGGLYDANFLAIEDPQGRTRTIALDDGARNAHLFTSPRPTGVGRSFALLKDNGATWNPGSPSIEIEVVSLAPPVGQIGVQGYLAGTTNPNDDSLSVWLEWVDAPGVVPAGTQIHVSLRVAATPATDRGDLNHDTRFDRTDAWLLLGLIGRTPASPDYNAYGDLDADGAIDAADYDALADLLPFAPADFNEDGSVNVGDLLAFLSAYSAGQSGADVDGSGGVSVGDFLAFLSLYAAG